jgi:hypothetical protein
MNKKAQIETALLVVVAIVLSAAALYTMISFRDDLQFQSAEMAEVQNELKFAQEFILSKAKEFGRTLVLNCPSCSQSELKTQGEKFDAENNFQIQGTGNFFAKLRNNEFTFEKKDSGYLLKIQDLFIQSENGANSITKNFSICFEFAKDGDFKDNC